MNIPTCSATVAREDDWWVITIPGVGVTQARTLADVDTWGTGLVRAMLDLPEDAPVDLTWSVQLPGDLMEDAAAARRKVADLADQQREAARASREAAAALRDAGLKGRDIAVLLGVTPARVSQLLKAS